MKTSRVSDLMGSYYALPPSSAETVAEAPLSPLAELDPSQTTWEGMRQMKDKISKDMSRLDSQQGSLLYDEYVLLTEKWNRKPMLKYFGSEAIPEVDKALVAVDSSRKFMEVFAKAQVDRVSLEVGIVTQFDNLSGARKKVEQLVSANRDFEAINILKKLLCNSAPILLKYRTYQRIVDDLKSCMQKILEKSLLRLEKKFTKDNLISAIELSNQLIGMGLDRPIFEIVKSIIHVRKAAIENWVQLSVESLKRIIEESVFECSQLIVWNWPKDASDLISAADEDLMKSVIPTAVFSALKMDHFLVHELEMLPAEIKSIFSVASVPSLTYLSVVAVSNTVRALIRSNAADPPTVLANRIGSVIMDRLLLGPSDAMTEYFASTVEVIETLASNTEDPKDILQLYIVAKRLVDVTFPNLARSVTAGTTGDLVTDVEIHVDISGCWNVFTNRWIQRIALDISYPAVLPDYLKLVREQVGKVIQDVPDIPIGDTQISRPRTSVALSIVVDGIQLGVREYIRSNVFSIRGEIKSLCDRIVEAVPLASVEHAVIHFIRNS